MKKLLMTFAAVAMMVSAASAQSLLDMNFEDGTHTFKAWSQQDTLLTVVDSSKANNSEHALQFKVGAFVDVKGFKKDVKYRLSFDKKFVNGKTDGSVTLSVYNPDVEGKFQKIVDQKLSQVKEFETVSYEFTSPRPFGGHRLVITPSSEGKGGGCFIIDNLKIEVVK
ncbi:MAG: carbohydrate binding domain-containing protein [Rikenellaceae bacterium]